MGLDVILQDEVGEQIEVVGDPRSLLARLLPQVDDYNYRCLSYIDRYGDTYFNRLQIDDLITELDLILSKAKSDEEIELLKETRRLATRAKEDVHLYLKFEGD